MLQDWMNEYFCGSYIPSYPNKVWNKTTETGKASTRRITIVSNEDNESEVSTFSSHTSLSLICTAICMLWPAVAAVLYVENASPVSERPI